MNLRKIEANDLIKLLTCNLHNIPENYWMKYWEYVVITWPELSFLAEDENGKVVGYVLSSIEPDDGQPYARPIGHINSVAVLRPYRRLGIAQKLMNLSRDAMLRNDVNLPCIQLYARRSNRPALSLYRKLGYILYRTEKKYYGDDEDALILRLPLQAGRPRREPWITNFWHFLHDRPRRIAGATMSLLRRRNTHP